MIQQTKCGERAYTAIYSISADLKAIFERHRNERICVIGTMCCGKTTMIKKLSEYNCVDVDDVFWPQIPKEEIARLSVTPITQEIMDDIFRLMREKVTVKPGRPLFGVTILDCDVVVYLDIAEALLEKHCRARGDTTLRDALFVKKLVEADLTSHKAKSDKVFYDLTVCE